MTERIDNYPGFPDGVGGAQLADLFVAQARRYGVELVPAVAVEEVGSENGGGNSGLEEGMFLANFAKRVRSLERHAELEGSKLLQDNVRSDPRFIVNTNTEVVALRGRNRLEEVVAHDRVSGEEHRWHPAAAFVFVGLDPNTEFLHGVVDRDRWGFVVTDARFQTSLPGLFCAGDVRQGSTKQLASAVGEGVTALLMVREYLREHHHLAPLDVNA